MEIKPLFTSRLELIPLRADQLSRYLIGDDHFEGEVGLTSRVILTETLNRAIGLKLKKMQLMEINDHHWITYWLMKHKKDQYGFDISKNRFYLKNQADQIILCKLKKILKSFIE